MTPCVEPQACHKQKAKSAANLIRSIHCFCRNRCQKRTIANGQKTNPTWQRNVPVTNLILPSGLANGVSDLGIKYQIGPVSSTIVINNTMPLDTRTPSESAMDSSPSRFESYQIFSTDARRVIILKGEKTMRPTKTANCSADIVR